MAQGKETKHFRAFRDTKLRPDERILGHLDGWIGEVMGKGDKTQHNGQFILTDQRACFYRKGVFGEVFETIPISKITSVESLSRMGYRVLRLHTSHDELAFKTFEGKSYFDSVHNAIESIREDRHQAARTHPATTQQQEADDYRDEIDCPHCAERILAKAKICKHCKLPVRRAPETQPPETQQDASVLPDCPPSFSVTCNCGARMKAKGKLYGKMVSCLVCKEPVRVVPDTEKEDVAGLR